jgi:two-component system, OmpR family, phosphate regulon response regulator PhoB
MAKLKILSIEDDRSIVELLRYNLEEAGYEFHAAYDGRDGVEMARLKLPDIILLDIMLPILDGVEVCRRLRAIPELDSALIIMLSAKSEEVDQLVGFNMGADDYVVKPFSIKVLLERIKSLQRRRTRKGTDVVLDQGIKIDRLKHRAYVDEKLIDLTPSEFRLLETLMRQPGRAFDRSELIDTALGADTLVLERTIDVHIRALRKKLGRFADRIETVRGIGYRFSEANHQDEAMV